MLLENEDYIIIDMKLGIRRVIGLHSSAIDEVTIARNVPVSPASEMHWKAEKA